MLVHVAIHANAGNASAVAQRFAFVEGLTLREVEGEDRLIGTLRVSDSCPLDDVIRLFATDPAVVGVHHLATELSECVAE